MKCYVWSIASYGAETWTLRAVDKKHLESFEMWCWRRMEKISWTDHVRNEEALLRVKDQRNILREIRKCMPAPLAGSDRGFESHRGHGYLSFVTVVCCQVEVSATS